MGDSCVVCQTILNVTGRLFFEGLKLGICRSVVVCGGVAAGVGTLLAMYLIIINFSHSKHEAVFHIFTNVIAFAQISFRYLLSMP
jgi:hypothetical protein